MSKLLNKLSKFSTIFHSDNATAPNPPPPHDKVDDVSRGQNRYVTLLLGWLWPVFSYKELAVGKYVYIMQSESKTKI